MPNERLQRHGAAKNAREELYDVLYEDGMYPYKFSDFSAKLDNPKGRDEIFDALMSEGMWDSTREEFDKTYSNGRGRFSVNLTTGGKKYFDTQEEGDAWAKSHQPTQAGVKKAQASEATNVQPTDAIQDEVNGILNGEAIQAPETTEQEEQFMKAMDFGVQAPKAQKAQSPYMSNPAIADVNTDVSAGDEYQQASQQLDQMRIDSASRNGDITPEQAAQLTMQNTASGGFAAGMNQEGDYVAQYQGNEGDLYNQKQAYNQEVERQRQIRVQTLVGEIDTLSTDIADLESKHKQGLDTIKRLGNEGDSTELAKIGAENAKISQELVKKRAELRDKSSELYKANGAVVAKINANLDEVENNLLDLSRRNKESVSLKNINNIKTNYTDAFDTVGKKANPSKLYTLSRFNIIEARNLINQADANANGQGICMGIWAGFADAVTNVKNWDFGVGEMLDYFSQRGILQKFDKQEEGNGGVGAVSHIAAKLKEGQSLTEYESLFLKSVLLKSAAEDITANALGRSYGVGRTTGEALPFMWEMYINPLGSMEDVFKKTTLGKISRGIVKRGSAGKMLEAAKWLQGNSFGKKVVQNIIMDVERVGRSVGMSLTSSLPRVVGGTVKDMNGELMSNYDDQGRIQFAGVREGTEMGGVEAFFKNLYSVSKESATEMNFGLLSGTYKLGKGAASSLMEKALKTTWGKNVHNGVKEMVNILKPTEFVDNMSRFLEQTQWHGTIEEYIEEVEGNVMDAIAGILTNGRWGEGKNFGSPDKEGSIFNLEDNIDTFLGVALMGGVFSTVKTFGYTTASREAKNRLNKANENGAIIFGKDSWATTKDILDRVDAAEISKFIQDRYRYTSLSGEKIKAIADYLRAREFANGVEMGKSQQDKQVESAVKQTYDQTVAEESKQEKTPGEKYGASNDLATATEALKAIPGGQSIIDQFEELIANGMTPEQSFAKLSSQLDRNQSTLLDNYIKARASVDGIKANIDEQVRQAEEDMMKKSPFDNEGNWSTVTYKNEEYFVLGQVGNKLCISKIVNEDEEAQKPIMIDATDDVTSTIVNHNAKDEAEKLRRQLEEQTDEQMNNHPSTRLASSLSEGEQVDFPVDEGNATTMIVTGVNEDAKTITIAPIKTSNDGLVVSSAEGTKVYSFDEFNRIQNDYWNQHAPVGSNLAPVSTDSTEGNEGADDNEQPKTVTDEGVTQPQTDDVTEQSGNNDGNGQQIGDGNNVSSIDNVPLDNIPGGYIPEGNKPNHNYLVNDEQLSSDVEALMAKLGVIKKADNGGIDSDILTLGTRIAVGVIERGAYSFADFSKQMVSMLGDAIRPYLKSFYMGAKMLPEANATGLSSQMSSYADVDKYDVDNFDNNITAEVAAGNGYTVEPFVYEKRNGDTIDMFLVKFPETLPKEAYNRAKELSRSMNGWFSSNDGGFLVRTEEDANKLGTEIASIVKNSNIAENNGTNTGENEDIDVSLLESNSEQNALEFNREKATLEERDNALGEALTLQEFIDRMTFTMQYIWSDKGDTKGLGAHTGGKRGERASWMRYLSNENGVSPEMAAHNLAQYAREAGFPDVDEYDVLNMIIDAFLSFGSRKKVIEHYEAVRDREKEYYDDLEFNLGPTYDNSFESIQQDQEPQYFEPNEITDEILDQVPYDNPFEENDINNNNNETESKPGQGTPVAQQPKSGAEEGNAQVGNGEKGNNQTGVSASVEGQQGKPANAGEGVSGVEGSAAAEVDIDDVIVTYEEAKSNNPQNIIIINDGSGNVYVTRDDLNYLSSNGVSLNVVESNGEKYAVIPSSELGNIMSKLPEDTFKMVPLNTGAAEKRKAMYDEAEKAGYEETMNELQHTNFTDQMLDDLIESNKRSIEGEDEGVRRYAIGSQRAVQEYLAKIDEQNNEKPSNDMQEVSMEEILGDESETNAGETAKEETKLLTAEQINSIPLSDEFDEQDRALALDYINGNINEYTENSYNLATYYVGDKSGNSEPNSGNEGSTLMGASSTPGEGGGQSNGSGVQNGNVDNGAGEQDVQPGIGSGENSPQDIPSTPGTEGDNSVAVESKPGPSSRGTKSGGGSRGRGNGHNVHSTEGQAGGGTDVATDAGGNATAEPAGNAEGSLDTEISNVKDEIAGAIADLLDGGFVKFVAQPNEGDRDAMLKRAQAFKKIQRLVFKLAGLYLKKGFNKFDIWMKNMIAQLKQLGLDKVYDDDKIESLVNAAWDSPLVIDGVTKKVSEWAAELEKEDLRKALNATREEKLEAQRKAESVETKVCDLDNIRESLPFLLPAQQEDVFKAETQFFDESHQDREHGNGKGFLFTNGTGTGKTYTGLGIVKRFVKQGKGRVLILTPSDEKVNDWCRDGRNLGLKIESLAVGAKNSKTSGTNYKGSGVVCTTYANMRGNEKILEDTFDLIIYDESHKIIENKDGEETIGAEMHYMLSNRDEEQAMKRLEKTDATCVKFNQVKEKGNKNFEGLNRMLALIADELNADNPSIGENFEDFISYLNATNRNSITKEELLGILGVDYTPTGEEINKQLDDAVKMFSESIKDANEYSEWKPKYEAKIDENGPLRQKAAEAAKKTKVVFLSATPFKGIDNLKYAEGYIFSFPEEDKNTLGSIDHKSGMDAFKLMFFGSMYRWRHHQIENHIENEDAAIKQQQDFADYLIGKLNTMSGRTIENGYDYSRTFPNVEFSKAADINEAMDDIMNDATMQPLGGFNPFNDYQKASILFETMKVSAVIPRIKEYLSKGKKVLIYHRRVNMPRPTQRNPIPWVPGNPFKEMMTGALLNAQMSGDKKKIEEVQKAIAAFQAKYADLIAWADKLDYRLPVDQLKDALGEENVGVFNGTVSNKVKHDAVEEFNKDESKVNVLIVQEESGKEGISLHDTTGNKQRVLMSLALPQQSTTFIQVEGRIYRIGNKSDAIIEYPLLGINREISLFALSFNAKVGITENLALGSMARGLQRSIARGVLEDSGAIPTDNQGKGGREKDMAVTDKDAFKAAIADYYATQKNTKTRDNREGVDYYATPEPLGYKMVQWLQLNEGETMLEPSAGHGAIARYFPATGRSLAIEPSGHLFSRLALNTGGVERGSTEASGKQRLLMNGNFESLEMNNKYDAVVMNPPFGVAGATAIKHIEKAWKHLRNGGRMVALVPVGAMDKKMDSFFKENPNAIVVGEMQLPTVTFDRAGTAVRCRVLVIDKIDRPSMRRKAAKKVEVDLTGVKTIDEFFNSIKEVSMPGRVVDPMSKLLNHGEKFKASLAENKFVENKTTKDSKGNEKRNAKAGKNITVNEDGVVIELGFPKKFSKNTRLSYPFTTTAYSWRSLRKIDRYIANQFKKAVDALKIEDDDLFMDAISWTWSFEYKQEDVKEYRSYLQSWVDLHKDVSGFTEQQIIDYAEGKIDLYESSKIKNDAIITLNDLSNMVEDLTDNKALLELSSRVFAVAERLGVKVHTANNPNSHKAGMYSLRSNTLELNSGYWNEPSTSDIDKAATVIHELIHACTLYATRKYNEGDTKDMTPEMIDACKRLEDLYNKINKDYRWNITYRSDKYALDNMDEFIAELSDPKFRDNLKRIKLWTKIVNAIKKFFGIRELPSDVKKTDMWGDVDEEETRKKATKAGYEESNALKEAMDILDVFLDNPNIELFKKRNSDVVSFKVIDGAKIPFENEQDARFRGDYALQGGLYSNAERGVSDIKQNKASAEQWKNMLVNNGAIKAGEDKWIGLSDYLDSKKGETLTKSEVLQYVRDNAIEVQEVNYGDGAVKSTELDDLEEKYPGISDAFYYDDGLQEPRYVVLNDKKAQEFYKEHTGKDVKLRDDRWLYYDGKDEIEEWFVNNFMPSLRDVNPINPTRLQYTTEGLYNKKEIALVVPNVEPFQQHDGIHFGTETGGKAIAWCRFGETTTTPNGSTNEAYSRKICDELEEKYGTDYANKTDEMTEEDLAKYIHQNMVYRQSTLDDLEFNLRDVEGERKENVRKMVTDLMLQPSQRVLVIDEIQSNRHQEGRQKGYDNTSKDKTALDDATTKLDAFRDSMRKKYDVKGFNYVLHLNKEEQQEYENLKNSYKEASRKYDEALENSGIVPGAPFENNWMEVVAKRMIRYAAENGFDKVAWTSGEQQTERYSLGGHVSSIVISHSRTQEGKYYVTAYDSNEMPIMGLDKTMTKEEMVDTYGNNMTDQLLNGLAEKDKDGLHSGFVLDGQDANVGGEGMRTFYNKMLVNFMNKFGKKFGAKVGVVNLPNVEKAGQQMWSIDITHEMRRTAMEEGLPLFRKGNAGVAHTEEQLDSMQSEVQKVADELNVNVVICRNENELANSELSSENAERMKMNGKGVFIVKSGNVVIYLPNNVDAKDAVKTLIHEIVGHKGLRDMVGKDAYDALLRKLYVSLPKKVRKEINRRAITDYNFNIYEALDEYLAEKAELDETPSWWYRAIAFVRQILRQVGINIDLNDNDVKYLLWQSKNQLRSGNVVDTARSKVIRARLGIGNEGVASRNRENNKIKNEVKDQDGNDATDQEVRFSLRSDSETPFENLERRKVYKLMRLMPNGKLQTLYIGREDYELGNVYNADSPDISMYENLPENFAYEITEAGEVVNSKPITRKSGRITGLPSKSIVEQSNKRGTRWVTVTLDAKGKRAYANVGINGAEGVTTYAMRPGIHAGNLPVMTQIGSGTNKDIRDDNLVFVEGEIAYGNGAPEEALENGGEITSHIPVDGGYEKGTSSFVTKGVTWYISGAFKPMRIISDDEARAIIDDFNKNVKEEGQPNVPYDYQRRGGRKFYTDTMRVEEDRDKNPKPPTPGGKITTKEEIQDVVDSYFNNYNKNVEVFVGDNNTTKDELLSIGCSEEDANSLMELKNDKDFMGGFCDTANKIIIFANGNETDIYELNGTIFHENVHEAISFGGKYEKLISSFQKNKDGELKEIYDGIDKKNYTEEEIPEEFLVRTLEKFFKENRMDDISKYVSIKELEQIKEILNRLGYGTEKNKGNNLRLGNDKKAQGATTKGKRGSSVKKKVVDTTSNGTNIIANQNGYARNRYENMLKRGLYKLQEQWQDSMLGLKSLMKACMSAEGKSFDDVMDFENPYMYENHMSSINNAECELYRNTLYQPLLDIVGKITGNSTKEPYELLKQYLVSKHGIERNDKFAMRDAENRAKEELDYDNEISKIEKQYDNGDIDEDERDEKIQILKDSLENLKQQYYEENRERDYSGLTALYAENEDDTLDDIEARAQEFVDEYEKEHAGDIDELWQRINDCNKAIIEKQHESGLISTVVKDQLNNMFEYYVPLRGFDEKTSNEIYDYLQHSQTPMNAPVKKAEGRKSLADDPIATIGNMAESGIVQANRNNLKEMFLRFVQNHKTDLVSISEVHLRKSSTPAGDVWEFVSPEFDENDSAADIKRKIEEFEDWFNEQKKNEPKNYKKGKEAANIPYRTLKQYLGEHNVIVKRNGVDKVITINGNPRAAQAINGLTNPETVKGFTKVLASVSRWMARMNTTFSPAFVISNLFRDGIYSNSMVWVKESPGYAFKYNRNWDIALIKCGSLIMRYNEGTLGNSEIERYFKEFIENGGETGQTRLNDVDEYKGIITKSLNKMARSNWNPMTALENMGEVIEFSNRWAEDTSRFAAYITSRQMGRSILRSVHDAKEISVNFNKKGAGSSTNGKNNGFVYNLSGYASQQARALYMFFNAGVQGLANISNAAVKNPKKFAALTSTFFAGGAMQPLMNQILVSMFGGDDDDDYYNIPEYVRRQNLCLFVGNGYIKIPLPIELRAIFGMGELASGQVMGGTKYNVSEMTQRVAEQFGQLLPIDMLGGQGIMELVPSAARPVVEIEQNVDWTGLPVYKGGDYMKSAPGWCKAYSKTNPLLVDLCMRINDAFNGDKSKYAKSGSWLTDTNPAILEHLYDGYLGGVGTFFKQAFETGAMLTGVTDFDMRRVPIASRFFMQTDERMLEGREAQRKWFDAKEESDDIQYEFRMLKKDAGGEDSIYARKEIYKLVERPEFIISEVFKEYDKGYKELKEAERAGADVKDNIINLQKSFVEDADSIREDFKK